MTTWTLSPGATVASSVNVRFPPSSFAILRKFFSKINDGPDEIEEVEVSDASQAEIDSNEDSSLQVEELDLPTRTINALKKAKINTVKELLNREFDELSAIKGLGEKSVEDIKKVLDKMNIDYNLDDSNNSIERDKEGENNNGESPTKATSNNDKKIISEEKLNMLIEKMNEKKLGYAIDEKKAQTNRATRLVMSELHTKTHFKALSCLSSKY